MLTLVVSWVCFFFFLISLAFFLLTAFIYFWTCFHGPASQHSARICLDAGNLNVKNGVPRIRKLHFHHLPLIYGLHCVRLCKLLCGLPVCNSLRVDDFSFLPGYLVEI